MLYLLPSKPPPPFAESGLSHDPDGNLAHAGTRPHSGAGEDPLPSRSHPLPAA